MRIIAPYSRACHATDLTVDEYHTAADNLAAVAIANAEGIGAMLLRIKYAKDDSQLKRLIVEWTMAVEEKAKRRKWPADIPPKRIAALSLAFWRDDKCQSCKGTRYLPLKGNPKVLSDDPCPHCKGTGVEPVRCNRALLDYVEDMVAELNDLTAAAGGRAWAKLGKEMDFL